MARLAMARRMDTDPAWSPWVRRHLDACGPCARHLQLHRRIARELARDAAQARVPAPPFLEGRIRAAVRRTETTTAFRPRSWKPVGVMALIPAVLLAVVVIVSLRPPAIQETPIEQVDPAPTARTAVVPDTLLAQANRDVLFRLGHRLEEPLETEMRLVMNDARRAMAALADSFLPDPLRQTLREKVRLEQ
jgi:hypothetical protein